LVEVAEEEVVKVCISYNILTLSVTVFSQAIMFRPCHGVGLFL